MAGWWWGRVRPPRAGLAAHRPVTVTARPPSDRRVSLRRGSSRRAALGEEYMPSTAPSLFIEGRVELSFHGAAAADRDDSAAECEGAVRSSPRLTFASSSTMRSKPPTGGLGRLQVQRVAVVERRARRAWGGDQLRLGVAAGGTDHGQKPAARANCTAARPTPPLAPCTSTVAGTGPDALELRAPVASHVGHAREPPLSEGQLVGQRVDLGPAGTTRTRHRRRSASRPRRRGRRRPAALRRASEPVV